jgi:hypothetical protein
MGHRGQRRSPVDAGDRSVQLERLLARIVDDADRYLACGRGWYGLLAELEERIAVADPDCRLFCVGELDGRLHIEVAQVNTTGAAAIRAAVVSAERRAARTCEFSGEPGIIMERNGMFRVLNPSASPQGYRVVIANELSADVRHLLTIIEQLVENQQY